MDNGQDITSQSTTIIAVSAGLSFVAFLAVILRFLVRRYKSGKYYLDDHLIVIGLVSGSITARSSQHGTKLSLDSRTRCHDQ